ncbi:hypothetical protein NYW84_10280 [Acinetobacter junii]|uniref:hypothetical protein n=1 Tax=Acinetobacter junii TaxID=40215 RepID=UPI002DB9FBB7|nr:hypothetical protein [Acinetobacter junii]MEB8381422.1 hypothetical protein [Acinetobacter junii]
MVASTDIKFYVHSNSSAPQLTNNYGCMIDVLDACLVNGFGSQTVSTLTASGTTVTATFGAAHNFMQYQVIKITGAAQAEFNGEHRILTVPNSSSITFQLAATPSVSTATGTIVCSLPPLGWEKPFSSSNPTGGGKAAYRSTNLLLPSRPFLRVVDELDPAYTSTYAKYAKVGIVEDMTDIDTMLGVQAPFDAANPNKNWVGTGSGTSVINGWAKWYYSHFYSLGDSSNNYDLQTPATGVREWIVVGTTDYFYILPCTTPTDQMPVVHGFGYFAPLLNNDTSSNFLAATVNYAAANISYNQSQYSSLIMSAGASANSKLLLQRGYAQVATYAQAGLITLAPALAIRTGYADYIGGYGLVNITPFVPIYINETVLRGQLCGIFWLLQKTPYPKKTFINHNGAMFIALNCGAYGQGQIILKIGGE